jgi:hypothetical protein
MPDVCLEPILLQKSSRKPQFGMGTASTPWDLVGDIGKHSVAATGRSKAASREGSPTVAYSI